MARAGTLAPEMGSRVRLSLSFSICTKQIGMMSHNGRYWADGSEHVLQRRMRRRYKNTSGRLHLARGFGGYSRVFFSRGTIPNCYRFCRPATGIEIVDIYITRYDPLRRQGSDSGTGRSVGRHRSPDRCVHISPDGVECSSGVPLS